MDTTTVLIMPNPSCLCEELFVWGGTSGNCLLHVLDCISWLLGHSLSRFDLASTKTSFEWVYILPFVTVCRQWNWAITLWHSLTGWQFDLTFMFIVPLHVYPSRKQRLLCEGWQKQWSTCTTMVTNCPKVCSQWVCSWGQASVSPQQCVQCRVCLYGTYVGSVHHSRYGRLSWSLVSCAVTATTCAYCPAPFCLLCRASISDIGTTLEWYRQRERDCTFICLWFRSYKHPNIHPSEVLANVMAAETQGKRATTLHRLRTATWLTFAPQCSTFS